ncbi:T9SS type A sorting domain-containing protein [Polaribacter sp. 20A6]|uniref:T9SS type A sorting domain-containing protein n=1 Tax=Polaribacter sp. 20A6 TaxID=2687289 RepID=UPI001F100A67|nr:T9SS type A sorting domain-containing protein [Polaribacter sp. 20A6]
MKKKLLIPFIVIAAICVFYITNQKTNNSEEFINITLEGKLKPKNKPKNFRQLYSIKRDEYESNMQKNPLTGEIPKEEKLKELNTSLGLMAQKKLRKKTSSTYTSRGPSNLGGRTRAFAVDISDTSSNTMLSGGVSSGLFRTIDGGLSWTKVTPLGEIHNVSALTQDPREGFQNIWYYGTGEWSGNSASLGSAYKGQGVWKSIDGGLTWSVIPGTDSDHTVFDSYFDFTNSLEVSPITGELFIATSGRIYRYDGVSLNQELKLEGNSTSSTDLVITPNGNVYASFDGSASLGGVWMSPTGNGVWTQIAQNGTPTDWSAAGRIVLGEAPSADNIIYALYVNGNSGGLEGDLWQYNATTTTWTNYSSKLPDEPGSDSDGNDPFAVQGGYDLVVTVKPDNENFVTIGGTNAYKIADIRTDVSFSRIGGYANNTGYSQYENHHPDIHVLEFDPNNNDVFYSGTDGGVHKTLDINEASIAWLSLNNNYLTYQYYHVTLDPFTGSNIIMGGAQDNGTTIGGTHVGLANNTTMNQLAGGDGVAVGLTRRDNNTALQYFLGFQQGAIYTNYPDGFREITPKDAPTGVDAQFITYYYLDPDNTDYLYYAAKSKLYKTNASAAVTDSTWTDAGTLSNVQNLRTFATTRGTYSSALSYLLIGGDKGGVFKLKDPKDPTSTLLDAVDITPTGATTSSNTIVSDIAIHPTNPDIVLVVYANYGISNIFLTTNATDELPTWTLVERNLNAHSIRSAEITEVGEETVYFIGTARGLYSSTDPTSVNWEMEGESNIGLALISSLAYRPADNKLLIGTHGNGMYETTIEGTLSTNSYASALQLSFYPNPTKKELNLQSNTLDLSQNLNYTISDLTGKVVKKGVLKDQKINVEYLNDGVYLINLSVDGKNQNFKFIKN